MKFLYIYFDESGDASHYVLTAVGSHSPDVFKGIVNSFRKEVRNSTLSDKDKAKINNDPKEQMLYRYHNALLSKYVDLIALDKSTRKKPIPRSNVHLSVAFYKKTETEMEAFQESRMLDVYEGLFLDILDKFVYYTNRENLYIIFDHFVKAEEMKIRLNSSIPNQHLGLAYTLDYAAGGEKGEHTGLFVADIVAGTSRRHLAKETINYFYNFKHMLISNVNQITI